LHNKAGATAKSLVERNFQPRDDPETPGKTSRGPEWGSLLVRKEGRDKADGGRMETY